MLLGAPLLAACASGVQARQPNAPRDDASKQTEPFVTPEPAAVDRRTVKVGEAFSVTLEANVTTGSSWEVAEIDEGFVHLVSNQYVSDSNPGQLGQPGKAVLQFQAVSKGQTVIKLVYHRPWEKSEAPLKICLVELSVQ